MPYSVISSNTHATQAFPCWEQSQDEFLNDYLHFASELLSKIYYTSNMSSISAEGTYHYAAVYDLNCWKLKDSITGH